MKLALKLIFWLCGVGLFYIYFGYPLLISLLSRCFPRKVKKAPFVGAFSVLIVAYNEASKIGRKIESVLQSDLADHMTELIVASDGSTDSTVETARRLNDPRIRVLDFVERRGKVAVLNEVIPQCVADIIVLTDARQKIDSRAIGKMLANFVDPRVGVVSGELVFPPETQTTAMAKGFDFYWNYEKFIRKKESLFRSVPGATGALYALRKNLFSPIPVTTLLDDVVIPMQAIVRGGRCLLEEEAYVYDEPSLSMEKESIRKRRTIAGNFQVMGLFPLWLVPCINPIWFEFMSHKMTRLVSPFLLVGVWLSSAFLMEDGRYAPIFWMQCLLYGITAVSGSLHTYRWVGALRAFVVLNWVTCLAFYDALSGRFNVKWKRK